MYKVKGISSAKAAPCRSLIEGHEEVEGVIIENNLVKIQTAQGPIIGRPEDYLLDAGDFLYVLDEETFSTLFTRV